MAAIETVRIVCADTASGWIIINRCDLQDGDVLVDEESAQPAKPAKAARSTKPPRDA